MNAWVARQRNILEFTLSSLLRRKGKNLALLFVYTSVVAMLASVMFFLYALRREAALLLDGSPEVVVQRMVAGRHDLIPTDYAVSIGAIPGVSRVRERLWGYYFDPVSRANLTLLVPPENPPAAGKVVIGHGVARIRKLIPGNLISIPKPDGQFMHLEVAAILPEECELVTCDLILIAGGDFRTLFGIPPDRATDLTLRVRNPREEAMIAAKIHKLLPDTRPLLRSEILRTYDAIFAWRGGMVTLILATAVLSFVIFSWDKASGLSAEEKREIGILKAIGWETGDVISLKFWEGTVISLTAFFTGMLLAYVHVFIFSGALFAPVMKGWSTLYPNFQLVPFINPHQVAILFFLTVVPYTAATVIPSWRAAIIEPDAVMRS